MGAAVPIKSSDVGPPPPPPASGDGPAIALQPSEAIVGVEAGGLHTTQEMQLTYTIMGFGLFALLFLYLMSRQKHIPPFVLRVYVITIIIFGTLAVVASAYTNDQIAPVVGLFGTIAGYVLGRTDRPADPLSDPAASPPPPSPPPRGEASEKDVTRHAGDPS